MIGDVDEHGRAIKGDSILLLINAFHEAIPFKIPARIEFLDSLPKGPSGKILKRALKEQFTVQERS